MVPAVLSDISELSNDWLSAVLEQPVAGYATHEIVGEGYASRMYRITLGEDDPGPQSLILKLATVQPEQQELMDRDIFCREVEFYSQVSGQLKDRSLLPEVYFAGADKDSLQLTLLLEDLGEIPHKQWREPLENSLAAVTVLAKIHADYWHAEILNGDKLSPIETEVSVEDLQQLLDDNLAVEADADYDFPYLRDCMHHVRALAPWLIGEVDQFNGAMTLVHGDFHNRNIHFFEDRTVVFDWQVTERGRPVRDLIYWLLACVDVEEVDETGPKLVERYRETLKSLGVDYADKAFNRDYREAVVQMVSRTFCYQTLVSVTEEDAYFTETILSRSDKMAKAHYVRAQLRIARVIAPPLITVMRWLGLR